MSPLRFATCCALLMGGIVGTGIVLNPHADAVQLPIISKEVINTDKMTASVNWTRPIETVGTTIMCSDIHLQSGCEWVPPHATVVYEASAGELDPIIQVAYSVRGHAKLLWTPQNTLENGVGTLK